MRDCVEDGVSYGVRRAFKYADTPTPESIIAAITDAVMCEICEKWEFQDEPSRDT